MLKKKCWTSQGLTIIKKAVFGESILFHLRFQQHVSSKLGLIQTIVPFNYIREISRAGNILFTFCRGVLQQDWLF